MAYKVQLEDRKKDEQQQPKMKVLAFNVSSDIKDLDKEEDGIAMISRKFKKFLRQGKFKRNKDSTGTPLCFK